MRHLWLVGLFLMTGCGAHMVNTRGAADPNAPVNEGKGGTIKYLNSGAQSVVQARRRNAYKQMNRQCGGAYRIISEGTNPEGGLATTVGGVTAYGQSQYNHIQFECEPK